MNGLERRAAPAPPRGALEKKGKEKENEAN